MTQKQNILSSERSQDYLLKNSFVSTDISEEIIFKLEELNRKLDKFLNKGGNDEKKS